MTIPESEGIAAFGDLIERLGDLHGDRIALMDEQLSSSYRELAAQCNRYTNWAFQAGFQPGTVIALLMSNCTEYISIWAGLSRAGLTVALINTNLSGAALLHALRAGQCSGLIVAAELYEAYAAIEHEIDDLSLWIRGDANAEPTEFDRQISSCSADKPRTKSNVSAPALLIYTSGTTGLPKAAKVSHRRVLRWSYWFAGILDMSESDRLYNCLPMYHSVGGVCAIGAVLVAGGSAVIRRRFSASRFWQDIVESNATVFQYIGELCRYLLLSPPSEFETRHNLRVCVGNGLRKEVWEKFEARFQIPRIFEFYASTEGSISLYNCEGKPGAIGRVPPFLRHRFPLALVRLDLQSGDLVRNGSGLCEPCGPDEIGEALGRLDPAGHSDTLTFEGYTSTASSNAKLARDVFEPGDLWYRTGDLMRFDPQGFYYFNDRLGDTFRWKGENVSGQQVAAVMMECTGVTDAVVFGVSLARYEGQAGMAVISENSDFNLETLWDHVHRALPGYARPMLLRRRASIERTSTFKLRSSESKAEGYRDVPPDELWFDLPEVQRYVPLSQELMSKLEAGELRL